MKTICTFFTLIFAFFAAAQTYNGAESVDWDSVNQQWLVSNGGQMVSDDGMGNLEFFGSAVASYGLEVIDNVVFAISGIAIKGYDLTSQQEVMSISIPGAGFLNGLGSDGANNILYVSDFGQNKIHAINVSDLNNPVVTELVSSTGQTPNGVLFDEGNNRLLFGTWEGNAKIKEVDLTDNSVSTIISTGLANIDGIVRYNNEYYISTWGPSRITKYNADFTIATTITTPSIANPADIGISPNGVLAIPVGNNVVFVDLEETAGINDLNTASINFQLSENPIKVSSFVQFELLEKTTYTLSLSSIEGKQLSRITTSSNAIGVQRVPVSDAALSEGVYFLTLHMNGQSLTTKIVVAN
ncbi:MAG: glutamine cyclotransferase [Patiriisocius sp.]|jgi:glutamine cyclotransferase